MKELVFLQIEPIPVYRIKPDVKSGRNGKTNIKNLQGISGIYRVYESASVGGLKKMVYVGHAKGDLYKTIMRHFQRWNDSEFPDRINYRNKLSEKVYWVAATIIEGDENAETIKFIERALILEHKPRDNNRDNYTKYNNKFPADYFDKQMNVFNETQDDAVTKEEWERYSYNENGELLDENGEVIF